MPNKNQDGNPGKTDPMEPQPQDTMTNYKASGKLEGKVAIVTGGDSGIGRATAIAFAKEGADVAIVYLEEGEDAEETKKHIEATGRKALCISGDIGLEKFCQNAIEKTIGEFGKLDILVNNAGEQHPQKSLEDVSTEQFEKTFQTNIFGFFFMTKAALPHLKEGSVIINTTSITAYRGHKSLIDYSSTKGAILSFTRALAGNLAEKKIRVNAVAPGPIWTPLIPSTFSEEEVEKFGKHTPLGRPGQPDEVAPAYVYLASNQDSSYVTGQTIHVNGGQVVGG